MIEASKDIMERVAKAIHGMDADVDADTTMRVGRWIATVEAWNRRIDLTAARSLDELVDLMLADALVLAPRMPPAASVVDVGTGAGAPGLAVALLRPDLSVTLVEPLQKRMALLRTVIGAILSGAEKPRVRAVRARGEDLVERGEAFDTAMSRATLAPAEWLRMGAALSRGRDVWVLLAREEPPIQEGLRAVDDIRYRWPLTGAPRRATRFVRGAEDGRL